VCFSRAKEVTSQLRQNLYYKLRVKTGGRYPLSLSTSGWESPRMTIDPAVRTIRIQTKLHTTASRRIPSKSVNKR
jgi:hypothetical protein